MNFLNCTALRTDRKGAKRPATTPNTGEPDQNIRLRSQYSATVGEQLSSGLQDTKI